MTEPAPGPGPSPGFIVTPEFGGIAGQLAQASIDFGAALNTFTSASLSGDALAVPEVAQVLTAVWALLEPDMNVTALAYEEAVGNVADSLASYGQAETAATKLSASPGTALS